jgi:hypothetical protein
MKQVWLRRDGDAWCVDTSGRREVYRARPILTMEPAKDRAEAYLRAVEAQGYTRVYAPQPTHPADGLGEIFTMDEFNPSMRE